MKSTFVISLVFLLACASCSSSSNPTGSLSGTGTLAGKVALYAPDGTALTDRSGVNVSVQGTSALSQSDTQGNWKIDNLPAGVYNIIFSKAGFDTMTYTEHHFLGAGTDFLLSPFLNQGSNDSIVLDNIAFKYNYTSRDSIYEHRDTIYSKDSIHHWDSVREIRQIFHILDSTFTIQFKGHLQGADKPPYLFVYMAPNVMQVDSGNAPSFQMTIHADGSFSDSLTQNNQNAFGLKPKQTVYLKATTLSTEMSPNYNYYEGPRSITHPFGVHATRSQFTIP